MAVVLLCGLLCAGPFPAAAQSLAPARQDATQSDTLTKADLAAAFVQLDDLGAFFGAFAERDTNLQAQDRWRRLSVNYRETAARLRALHEAGDLLVGELEPGRASLLLADGRLVVDSDLDGRWTGTGASEMPGEALRDRLLPVLMQALARRNAPPDWPWMADHLDAAGGLSVMAESRAGRVLLARFFQAKDAYLWLAMQRIAQGDPAQRQALARRQAATFEEIRGLRDTMKAVLGPPAATRLQRDWSTYVAEADGYATTRGWLLLDPALRLTQLGRDAKTDAVDLAAAQVVSEAPRSAVAAARSELQRLAQAPPAASKAETGAPLETAAGIPESLLAAEVQREIALAELRAAIGAREAELATVRDEMSGLRTQVGELEQTLAARSAEAARLQEDLAQAEARASHIERQTAGQAALTEALAGKVAQLSSLEGRMTELERLLSARSAEAQRLQSLLEEERDRLAAAEAQRDALVEELRVTRQAPQLSVVPPARGEQEAAALSRLEQRQFLIILALVLIPLVALLVWWSHSRRRAAPPEAEAAGPLLLLRSPGQDGAVPVPQRPIIDMPSHPSDEGAAAVAEPAAAVQAAGTAEPLRYTAPPKGVRIRISGVEPATGQARAAMKAAAARTQAVRTGTVTAKVPPQAANHQFSRGIALGRESAAAASPLVRALRRGNLPLFELLFGEMTGLRAPQLQNVVYGGQGEDLLVVCRAVGIDQLLFGSIFLLTDPLRGGDADEDPARAAEVLRMYERLPVPVARKVLGKWQQAWGYEVLRSGEVSQEETSLG